MARPRSAFGSLALILALLASCGDPPLPAKATDAASAADIASASDSWPFADAAKEIATLDGAADGAVDAASQGGAETVDGAIDAAIGADGQGDTAAPGDAGSVDSAAPADTVKPADVPIAEFTLVSSIPADGAADIALDSGLAWKFSTTVKPESAVSYTISVQGPGNTAIPGKFTASGDMVTFVPKGPLPVASRIDVVLGTLVQSNQGVPLSETKLHFYTQPWADLQKYHALAEQFAPQIRQAVATPADYLRALDFDGDWNAWDNPADAKAFLAAAEVGWTAVETRSHVYLTYSFYWPQRTAVPPGVGFDNDIAGAQVVVERKSGQPVALQTFFKAKADEQAWLWLTAESGFPVKSKYFRAFLPRDQLFPPADAKVAACQPGAADAAQCKRRYPAYLTAGNHQSCLWIDKGETLDAQCVLNDYLKSQLLWVVYAPGAAAKEPGQPTNAGTPADYTLRPLHSAWWPHREEAGLDGLFADTQFIYAPPTGRPLGPKYGIGSRLANPQDVDFGRPPWAWRWKPGTFSSSYYDLPRGVPLFDPAHLLYQRLGGATVGPPAWDPATKNGFSQDYCFNPYLGIDARQTPECQ